MSNTAMKPSSGAWGWFGADTGSQLGKIRGAVSEAGGTPTQTGSHPVTNFAFRDIPGAKSVSSPRTVGEFKSKFYNPFVDKNLIQPLSEQSGLAGTDTLEGLFETVDLTATEGQGIAAKGTDLNDIRANALQKLTRAEELKDETIEGLDLEETSEREAFGVGQQEIAEQRKLAARGAEQEYAQADIQAGATGMAMSAPAAQGYQMEGSQEAMRGLGTQSSELRRGLTKSLTGIEGRREEAIDKYEGEEIDYHTTMQEAYKNASTALDDVTNRLTEVVGYHTNVAPGEMGLTGVKNIRGMFAEGKDSAPGYAIAEGKVTQAKSFADQMAQAARESLAAVGE